MANDQTAIGDAALIQHRTGWLRPDSVVIGSPSYGHVESVLAWSPEYTAWVRALEKLEALYQEDKESFAESLENDGSGWHAFTSDAQNEAARQRGLIMRHLYQAGWIRIGFSTGERGHKSPTVEFEGCEAVLRERDDVLWQLCERIMRSPTMLPVRQRTDPVHLALPQASVADHHPEFFEEMMASFRQSKAFKGGIKEGDVAFSARWTSTIDAPSPRDLPEKLASGMLEYNLSAHAPRWRGGHAYVSSSPKRRCPPEIVADAVQRHAVDIPTNDELAEILVRSGSPSSSADLVVMLAEGSEQIRVPTWG